MERERSKNSRGDLYRAQTWLISTRRTTAIRKQKSNNHLTQSKPLWIHVFTAQAPAATSAMNRRGKTVSLPLTLPATATQELCNRCTEQDKATKNPYKMIEIPRSVIRNQLTSPWPKLIPLYSAGEIRLGIRRPEGLVGPWRQWSSPKSEDEEISILRSRL